MMAVMTKTLSLDLAYAGTLDQVTQMLADPEFREAVCDAQHALNRTVTSTGIPGTVDVSVVHPTDDVPSFAQRFVGGHVTVDRHEIWTDTTHADMTISAGFSAATMTGTRTLRETDKGVAETVVIEVSVKIPLIGGRVESLVCDLMTKAFDKEEKIAASYLDQS
jgi:hypothetical protein